MSGFSEPTIALLGRGETKICKRYLQRKRPVICALAPEHMLTPGEQLGRLSKAGRRGRVGRSVWVGHCDLK